MPSGFIFELEFEKDGDFIATAGVTGAIETEKGEWDWEDGKEKLEVIFDGSKEEWKITRLTNTEFEFEDEDREKYEFEKK